MKSGVLNAVNALGDALSKCKFIEVLQTIWKLVTSFANGIVNTLGDMISSLVDKLGNADFNGFIDMLNGLIA